MKRLEASDRQRREQAESENAESLAKALEEMERQQSGVLSAALQRSDAALGEVARVKEVSRNQGSRSAGVGLPLGRRDNQGPSLICLFLRNCRRALCRS